MSLYSDQFRPYLHLRNWKRYDVGMIFIYIAKWSNANYNVSINPVDISGFTQWMFLAQFIISVTIISVTCILGTSCDGNDEL